MRILVLAPHPFFQNRGTPIDVLLILRVLAERDETEVDLLTYNEGSDVSLPNLSIHRTPDLRITRQIRPGFSLKKIICDFFMLGKAWRMVGKRRYDLIHAGEEAVFIAMLMKRLYGIPYAYDLDSSIAQQMIEKIPQLSMFARLFNWVERAAIRNSLVNLPVCHALAELCDRNGSPKTVTIHDISQLKKPNMPSSGRLKKELDINNLILLYIGNLEAYQGIDLLLESFKLACEATDKVDLVIIGGTQEDIKRYGDKAKILGIETKTHFIEPRPFEELDEYLAEADILVAPRIKGINTPMKVFPYLHSGKPVLLTDLYTHSQVIPKDVACLAPADPVGFSKEIVKLSEDKQLRERLGQKGKGFVEKEHTYAAHQRRLNGAYDWIEKKIKEKSLAKERGKGVEE
jgi:glycosyltransferase involved in cell wall biosynthesis